MKKVWAILIIVALAVGMLTACATPAAEESASSEQTQAEESAAESSQAAPEGEPVTITWAVFENGQFLHRNFIRGLLTRLRPTIRILKLKKF